MKNNILLTRCSADKRDSGKISILYQYNIYGYGTGEEMTNKQQWVCAKCGGREADTGVVRTTGGGASRYFNIQNHKFEYVSCERCGYTDLFRPSDQGGGMAYCS